MTGMRKRSNLISVDSLDIRCFFIGHVEVQTMAHPRGVRYFVIFLLERLRVEQGLPYVYIFWGLNHQPQGVVSSQIQTGIQKRSTGAQRNWVGWHH